MRWLVDTSAWARRDQPEVAEKLQALLGSGDELALSPPVLLELLRGPQDQAVAEERQALTEAMQVIPADARTFELAADAMERLARHAPVAHRLPVTDLVTAALAHQHGLGVVHCDGDYAEIAEHGGLKFKCRRIELEAGGGESKRSVAARQRELRRELFQLLHRASIEEAEAFLERAVEQARRLGTRSG